MCGPQPHSDPQPHSAPSSSSSHAGQHTHRSLHEFQGRSRLFHASTAPPGPSPLLQQNIQPPALMLQTAYGHNYYTSVWVTNHSVVGRIEGWLLSREILPFSLQLQKKSAYACAGLCASDAAVSTCVTIGRPCRSHVTGLTNVVQAYPVQHIQGIACGLVNNLSQAQRADTPTHRCFHTCAAAV